MNDDELLRYSRHILLDAVGVEGQQNALGAHALLIGAGGLGVFISRGISQSDPRQLIVGAIAVSLLAIIADYGLIRLQKRLTPPGLTAAR